MNVPPNNLSSSESAPQESILGQLCGREELFCDRYQVLKMIGRGGYGVTYLVKDKSVAEERMCVIKQLCPRVKNAKLLENAQRRFQREAKMLSILGKHSQIPSLYDYFVVGEEFYLVQEYIEGVTLARWVRRYGGQPEYVVKRFMREMLSLLSYIHQHQVIHRDIKPQNIIRRQEDRRLVLIDFGAVKEQLAKAVEKETKGTTTHFIGTVGFAPPEQFSLRPVYSSDFYALGVTCLYLLTAKAPLDFECDRRTGQILWHDAVSISDSFAVILDKMLKVSLQERYSTSSEILQALDEESPQDNLEQCMNIIQRPTKVSGSEASSAPSRLANFVNKALRNFKKK